MPIVPVERGEIYYEVKGSGYPVLLFASGFLNSRIACWRQLGGTSDIPWRNPIPALARDFKVITLDIRNAGRSWAEVGPDYDWPSYTADHIALLDEIGVENCHVLGNGIGASFALALAHAAPERVASLALQNPIGLSGENRAVIDEQIVQWGARFAMRPDISPSALMAVGPRMFGGDFVFSVTRRMAGRIVAPTLLMPGDDRMHPPLISAALARLTGAELLTPWRDPALAGTVFRRIRGFFLENTPGHVVAAATKS
jgi:pimeloyl-ACP methyl ester carboxylesterase